MGNVEEKDTTYRLTRSTSFNARVEPIWMHFRKTQDRRGMIGSFLEKRRVKSLITAIHDGLAAQGIVPSGWDREEGECACNMKVDKMGLLQDLRSMVGKKMSKSRLPEIRHFAHVREWQSFCVPVDFARPFDVPGLRSRDVIPIGSSVRLQQELQVIGDVLRVGKKLNADKMVPFLQMKEADVLKAETKAQSDPSFWPVFSFCILKKLADVSVERGLPIVFA